MIGNLGKNIKKLRLRSGLSQQDLADELDISLGAISKIERGVTYPSFVNLEKISHILNTNATELFADNLEKVNSEGIHFVTENLTNQLNILDSIRGVETYEEESEVQQMLLNLFSQLLKIAEQENKKEIYEEVNHFIFSFFNRLNLEKIYENYQLDKEQEKQRIYKK